MGIQTVSSIDLHYKADCLCNFWNAGIVEGNNRPIGRRGANVGDSNPAGVACQNKNGKFVIQHKIY